MHNNPIKKSLEDTMNENHFRKPFNSRKRSTPSMFNKGNGFGFGNLNNDNNVSNNGFGGFGGFGKKYDYDEDGLVCKGSTQNLINSALRPSMFGAQTNFNIPSGFVAPNNYPEFGTIVYCSKEPNGILKVTTSKGNTIYYTENGLKSDFENQPGNLYNQIKAIEKDNKNIVCGSTNSFSSYELEGFKMSEEFNDFNNF